MLQKYFDRHSRYVEHGDIIDLHQTVNGQSHFIVLKCYDGFDVRYACDMTRKYEYDVHEMLRPCRMSCTADFEIVGNIYETLKDLTIQR